MQRFLKYFFITITFLWVLSCIETAGAGTFTDALGRTVILEKRPEKIVTLAPSLTEIIYYLGEGERVVGVTQFSYYPPEAAGKPKVGSYINLNLERIISLNPDLVIGTADGNKRYVVKLLEQAGIPVYIVNPRNVKDAIETIATLGRLCGVPEKAHMLTDGLGRRVEYILDKTASLRRPVVFLQINIKPIMTVNRNTFHHDVVRLAGGENMTKDAPENYPKISVEEVIRRKPEVIIISSMERGGRFERARKKWQRWPVIPAVVDKRVHLIDSDLIDRPSPRIVTGLEIMAGLIHPDVKWALK